MYPDSIVYHYFIQLHHVNYVVKLGIGVYVKASHSNLWGQSYVHDDMGNLVPFQVSKVDYFTFGKIPSYSLMEGVIRHA